MKRIAIAITAFPLLALAACNKPTNSKSSSPQTKPITQQTTESASGASANVPTQSPAPKKKLEEMTAMEVARDPAAYGFKKGGSTMTEPTAAGLLAGMKPSRTDQWTKETEGGKLYLLAITYQDDKMVSARWSGL